MKRESVVFNEHEWWDYYGDIQEQIWHYDAYLTQRVRDSYLAEMEAYLFNPGRRLLEFGCGTGWVGLRIAKNAMELDGVDISAEQISRAQQNAQMLDVAGARFIQGSVEAIPSDGNYTGVILHSLLHHLSESQIITLFVRLNETMLPGGRIYAYEPMAAAPAPPLGAWIFDKLILLGMRGLRTAVFLFHLQEPSVRYAVQSGWTMKSPDEAPITIEDLASYLPDALQITDVRYLHMCALAYANVCMGLRPVWRVFFSRWIGIFILLDNLILHSPWRFYLNAWPMAGIKIEKKL